MLTKTLSKLNWLKNYFSQFFLKITTMKNKELSIVTFAGKQVKIISMILLVTSVLAFTFFKISHIEGVFAPLISWLIIVSFTCYNFSIDYSRENDKSLNIRYHAYKSTLLFFLCYLTVLDFATKVLNLSDSLITTFKIVLSVNTFYFLFYYVLKYLSKKEFILVEKPFAESFKQHKILYAAFLAISIFSLIVILL